MKYATCVLVTDHRGHYLAVSRKDDHSKMGLPGGKLELDDGPFTYDVSDGILDSDSLHTLKFSASRELFEETGVMVLPSNLYLAYFGPCGDDFIVATFCSSTPYDAKHDPYLNDEGALVSVVREDALLEGPFGDYNTRVFESIERNMKIIIDNPL